MENELRRILLDTAAAFAIATNCKMTGVARRCRNDSNFFKRLANPDNSFTVRTFDEVMSWLEANWPEGKERPYSLLKWSVEMRSRKVPA